MKAHVYVTLKKEVLDPQGEAVKKALASLGWESVKNVRVGKFIELDVEAQDSTDAETILRSACEKLLANPVIEDYRFEVERSR